MPEPIRDDELEALCGPVLGGFRVLVLAVSGGADSTALMHLVARWCQARPAGLRPRVTVATFDHGLRAESAAEAEWVAERAAELGMKHQIMSWRGSKPKSGVQAAAREARYNALTSLALRLAHTSGAAAVVTAHHLEDQAETVLMRLARGSGLDGLSGMAPVRWVLPETLAIARPLLGVAKARLVATLAAAGAGWCDDPSNECIAFERVRVRRAARVLDELGLTAEALSLAARRAARGREALDAAVVAAERRLLVLNNGACAKLSRAGFGRLPDEIRVRILSRVLFGFGGQETPPGLGQVETLAGQLAGAGSGWRGTLGGCLVAMARHAIIVHREPAREPMPVVTLRPGEARTWDRRFLVVLSSRARRPVRIEALSRVAARDVAARSEGLPAAAATTLPSGWTGEASEGPVAGGRGPLVHVTFNYPRRLWG